MKNKLLIAYLCFGVGVCFWFTIAAANAWRAPNLGFLDGSSSGGSGGSSYGRSYGGSWGGGK